MEAPATFLQRAVALMSRKVDGLGGFDMIGSIARNEGYGIRYDWGRREKMKLVGELCTRYGDMCLGLNLDADVALLFSYSQAAFDIIPASWKAVFRTAEFNFNPKLAKLRQAQVVEQAFIDFTRAGYVTRIVMEEDLLARRLDKYKALVLVGITRPLPDAVMARIAEFQRNGGKVVVDDQTTIAIPDAIKLGVSFNEPGYQAWKQALQWYRAPVAERWGMHSLRYSLGELSWPVIREKLSFVKPFATRKDPRVIFTTQSWGKARYLFVMHDTVPPNWEDEQFVQAGSQWVYPIQTSLTLSSAGYTVYDVFSQHEVPLQREKEAAVLPVDLRAVEGRVFALLPAPIAGVRLEAPDSIAGGRRLPVAAHVVAADGRPIEAFVAVQLEVRGPGGEPLATIYRAAAGTNGCRDEFLIGVNERPGTYTIEVKELFSGRWARKTVRVRAGKLPPREQAVFEVPPVAVYNLVAVQNFIEKNASTAIALDDGQGAYQAYADSIGAALKGKGLDCPVVELADVIRPNDWNKCMYEEGRAERWHTTDLPDTTTNLILLSGEKPNRQLQAAHRHKFCSRPLTPNYPGPGKGIIDYVWSPFTGGYDAILIAANDDTGLRRAVELFVQLVNGAVPPEVTQSQTLARNLEHVRTTILPPRIAWRPAPPTFAPPVASQLTAGGASTGSAPEDFVATHFGDAIMALAASPNGRFIVAGTDSYFNNLFLLDGEGKVLWATKLGPMFIDKAAVLDDGTVIAASLVESVVRVYRAATKTKAEFILGKTDLGDPFAGTLNSYQLGGTGFAEPFAYAPETDTLLLNYPDRLAASHLDGRKLWEYRPPEGQRVFSMRFSEKGTLITVGC